MQDLPNVLSVQLGARDHYAFVRAFDRIRVSRALITDFWKPFSSKIPGTITTRARGRQHLALAGHRVRHANLAMTCFRLCERIRRPGRWEGVIAQNAYFQKKFVTFLEAEMDRWGAGGVVFSYSYAARDLFLAAKKRGWKTILGQIDPGPFEARIVEDLKERHPDYLTSLGPPPAHYFDLWKEETELADAILVNSEWSANALRHESVPAERLHTIPIPYHQSGSRKKPLGPRAFSKERPLKLLFLGQVNLRKGIAELLEAMSLLQAEPVELKIVGEVKTTIPRERRNLASVSWARNIPRHQVDSLYAGADLFILPTHSDGFGLTQVEALSAGLPVVASQNCARLVEDGRNGRLLAGVSGAEIASVIRDVLAAPQNLAEWMTHCDVPVACQIESVGEQLKDLLRGLS